MKLRPPSHDEIAADLKQIIPLALNNTSEIVAQCVKLASAGTMTHLGEWFAQTVDRTKYVAPIFNIQLGIVAKQLGVDYIEEEGIGYDCIVESHKLENKLSLGTKSPHAFATGNNHSKTKVDLVFCTKLVYNDNNGFSEIHASLVDLSQRTLPQITRWRDEQKKDKNGEVKNNNGFSTLEVAKHDAHIVTPVFGSTRPAVKFTYPTYVPFN